MHSIFARTLALVALLSAASAVAVPAADVSVVEREAASGAGELNKRLTGNVLLCSSSNWQNCDLQTYTLTSDWPCLPLPSRFDGHLGSIGPDPQILCRM